MKLSSVCPCLHVRLLLKLLHPHLKQVDQYKVTSPSPLGSLLLVRLEKQRYWVEDNWFCRYITVEPPGEDKVMTFPCYRWLIGDIKVEIREGTGRKDSSYTE